MIRSGEHLAEVHGVLFQQQRRVQIDLTLTRGTRNTTKKMLVNGQRPLHVPRCQRCFLSQCSPPKAWTSFARVPNNEGRISQTSSPMLISQLVMSSNVSPAFSVNETQYCVHFKENPQPLASETNSVCGTLNSAKQANDSSRFGFNSLNDSPH